MPGWRQTGRARAVFKTPFSDTGAQPVWLPAGFPTCSIWSVRASASTPHARHRYSRSIKRYKACAGVSVLSHPAIMVQGCRAHMLARDGRCKTFDARADGFGIGEGSGAVILERS